MKMKVSAFVTLAVVSAAVIIGVVAARPADAFPNKVKDCSTCHGPSLGTYAATVTANPSASTVAPGAAYTVAFTISENPNGSFNTGYWVANSDAAGATGSSTGVYLATLTKSQSYSIPMTAPATPGTYYYKVFGEDGNSDDLGIVGFKVYSITVVAPVHNVAVTYLRHDTRKRPVHVGSVEGFSGVFANLGNTGETFTATLTATSPGGTKSTLDTRSVTLAAGATTTVAYTDVLTYTEAGGWVISLSAGPVTGETATADNTLSYTRTVYSGSSLASPLLTQTSLKHRTVRR